MHGDMVLLQPEKASYSRHKGLNTIFFLTGDLLDERTAIVDGYNSYFSYSRGRSGYSGFYLPFYIYQNKYFFVNIVKLFLICFSVNLEKTRMNASIVVALFSRISNAV